VKTCFVKFKIKGLKMKEIYEELKKHKPKHKLHFEVEMKTFDEDVVVSYAVYRSDFWNSTISIYSFDTEYTKKQKINQVKKLMNNKRKALEFIGEPR
jgi:hypothetical protein